MKSAEKKATPRKKTCGICGVEKTWKFKKLAKSGRWIYSSDLDHEVWNGIRCYQCFLKQQSTNRRARIDKGGF